MSKLARDILAVQTEQKFYEIVPNICGFKAQEEFVDLRFQELMGYEIGMKIDCRVRVPYGDEKRLNRAIKDSRVFITEQVFGEFREPLLRLNIALHNQDIEQCKKILEEIYINMFVDGID